MRRDYFLPDEVSVKELKQRLEFWLHTLWRQINSTKLIQKPLQRD